MDQGDRSRTVTIYQIYYDEATRALLDPAFTPLDNSANERPDWAELWPIRRTLAAAAFEDDHLLGFFSPRFTAKTGLRGADVLEAVGNRDAVVYSFSPYLEQSALYLNPFLQGDAHHPGLLDAAQQVLPALDIEADLAALVCDQTTTVFGNYFVAPAAFWAMWLELAERVLRLCEEGRTQLARTLTAPAAHRGAAGHELKVFVVERLVTLLLEGTGVAAAWCLDPRIAPRSNSGIDGVVDALLLLDEIKRTHRRTGDPVLLDQYRELRDEVLRTLAVVRAATAAR